MDSNNMSVESSKSNRNLIIGVGIAVVLCCCCLVSTVAGYYGYQAYLETAKVIDQFENLDIPIDPNDPNGPQIDIPNLDAGSLPQGGLTDTQTRATAWLSVQLVAAISGCESPTADATTITVLEEPNASGEWVEEWAVDCGSSGSQPYRVTLTPENGIVNVNVEMP